MYDLILELNNFVASKSWTFASVAALFLVVLLITTLDIINQGIRAFILPRYYPSNLKRYGSWAVVTGATDGIGKAYCRCLAEGGMNIIIISKDDAKLQKTSDELMNEYGIKVSTIQADFRKGWALHEKLSTELKDKEIGLLVNNVGKALDMRRDFHRQKEQVITDLITINIESFLVMTTIILPQMLRRQNGVIVAMSSLSGQINTPMIALYGATKAALTALSRALFYEYRELGVEFQCLIPSCITTKIGLIKNNVGLPKVFFPDADTYCKSAVPTLGFTSYTTGYLPHSLKWLLIDKRINSVFMYAFKKFLMQSQLRRMGNAF